MIGGEGWTFCEQILPEVSRSFALIIPQCPPPIDRAMCVAYLICRLADTVEDEAGLADGQRVPLYDALVAAVDSPLDPGLADRFVCAWPALPEGPYGRLVEGTHRVLTAFASLPASLQPPIRRCVHDMIAGMRLVKPVESRAGVAFLCADLDDLDRYCHYVAGTVGIMATAMFESRFAPAGVRDLDAWREHGRRMGLGLQMTNILKDCRVDARRGVSFVPSCFTTVQDHSYDLTPDGRAELIGHTVSHLDAALHYTLAVPSGQTGIRTFLLGSMLPAIATLEATAPGDAYHPKITRAAMNEILELIARHAGEDTPVRDWYEHHREQALRLAAGLSQTAPAPDNQH